MPPPAPLGPPPRPMGHRPALVGACGQGQPPRSRMATSPTAAAHFLGISPTREGGAGKGARATCLGRTRNRAWLGPAEPSTWGWGPAMVTMTPTSLARVQVGHEGCALECHLLWVAAGPHGHLDGKGAQLVSPQFIPGPCAGCNLRNCPQGLGDDQCPRAQTTSVPNSCPTPSRGRNRVQQLLEPRWRR